MFSEGIPRNYKLSLRKQNIDCVCFLGSFWIFVGLELTAEIKLSNLQCFLWSVHSGLPLDIYYPKQFCLDHLISFHITVLIAFIDINILSLLNLLINFTMIARNHS